MLYYIKALIDLGRTEEGPTEECQAILRTIRRPFAIDWDGVAAQLSDDDLLLLIRGYTLAESRLRLVGGSVSPVLRLYRVLAARNFALADPLAVWIFRHRGRNTYLPFGSTQTTPQTLTEYRLACEREGVLWRQRQAEREQQAAAAREAKRLRIEQQRQLQLERHRISIEVTGPARRAFLAQLERLSPQDQLRQLARDSVRPATHYPAICAQSATTAVLGSLDFDTLTALLVKLAGIRMRRWKRLKARVERLRVLSGDQRPPAEQDRAATA